MERFPKGLRILVVDDDCDIEGGAACQLRHPELGYEVSAVGSIEDALTCFAGGATAFDCVLAEHSLVGAAPEGEMEALLAAAKLGQVPVVFMAEAPSQQDVLAGVRMGAADFLERPLSYQKLKTLWQHKIRRMMQSASGGGDGRRRPPSRSQSGGGEGVGKGPTPCASLPCISLQPPATPSPHASSCGATPAASCSLGSAGSWGGFQLQRQLAATAAAAAAAAVAVPPARGAAGAPEAHRSDATSSGLRLQAAAGATAAAGAGTCAAPLPPVVATAALQRPPLAPPGLTPVVGAATCRPPHQPFRPTHWPCLPQGTAWGTPVGCGIPPPPLLPGRKVPICPVQSAPVQPSGTHLAVTWCPPGSLPAPATTYDLLLPQGFSLAASPDSDGGRAGRGPLGLRLAITADLLAALNASLQPPAAGSH